MKKTIYIIAIGVAGLMLSSCGSKKEVKNAEDYGTSNEENVPSDLIAQGEALVKSSDCRACHHAVNKLVGPSHTDVAKKYEFTEANVKLLAEKIVKGGSGVWGEVPMSAHANVTQADAEKMARYVLSLDGEKEH